MEGVAHREVTRPGECRGIGNVLFGPAIEQVHPDVEHHRRHEKEQDQAPREDDEDLTAFVRALSC